MGFCFKAGEPVTKGVARMLRELAAEAVTDLAHDDRAAGVHEARKRFKKARALLRLARPGLGARFAAHNALLRDAGHRLAGMREADAMLECFERLAAAQRFGKRHQAVRGFLEERRVALGAGAQLTVHASQVEARLRTWLEELRREPPPAMDEADLFAGLRRSYGSGRQAWRAAMADPSPENLHDWRKRVKAHGYQLRLLERSWPELLAALRASHDHLAELLGDDHDLVALDALLAAEAGAIPEEAAAVRGHIAVRQASLRAEADRLARRLYAESPRRLARRLRSYWRCWQAEHGRQPNGKT